MTPSAQSDAEVRWLKAQWQFVRPHLPPAPAKVFEVGCGPYGGFVPALRAEGYEAIGVDPDAPSERGYHTTEFERFSPPWEADAIIACTSLHHTADLDEVVDRMSRALRPGGQAIVVEWDWQRFDERTAQWCFARLSDTAEPGWLHRHRDRWHESGLAWEAYLDTWAGDESLHTGPAVVDALIHAFDTQLLSHRPYLFTDLEATTQEDEAAAIEAGELQATGIAFVGTKPDSGRR